jgi:hypothetical protein
MLWFLRRMRAEADEAKVETEWRGLKRPNSDEDGALLSSSFCPFLPSLSLSPLHRPPLTPDPVSLRYGRRRRRVGRRSLQILLRHARLEELAQISRGVRDCHIDHRLYALFSFSSSFNLPPFLPPFPFLSPRVPTSSSLDVDLSHHAGFCHGHCAIFYVYIGDSKDSLTGGVLTFFVPAVNLDGDDDD